MGRFMRFTVVTFILLLCCLGRASATTYYIAANGSDSNNGISNTTPWMHAPGMPNCTGTCASTTPKPGDQFIFRGGDVWHTQNGSLSPYTGGVWEWTWSGGPANCNWPTVTTSCIYIGVDASWYSGASWTRPAFNFDNPLSKSLVARCAFDQSTSNPIFSIGSGAGWPNNKASYIVVDNFEFYGTCHSQPNPVASYISRIGNYVAIIHSYFHGWTMTNNPQPNGGAAEDQATIIGGYYQGSGVTNNVVAYDIFDGSDSYCTGNRTCSGGPVLYIDAYDFDHNVCRYIANCLNSPSNTVLVHNNLFEYVYESFDPAAHGGVMENYGNNSDPWPNYFYNNIIRHTNMGVTYNPNINGGQSLFFFNNVFYDIANGSNCISIGGSGSSTGMNVFVANNTLVSDTSLCSFRFTGSTTGAAGNFVGTATFQNNHIINSGSTTMPALMSTANCRACSAFGVDKGNEIFQSGATANSQGYTASNNYQPTSTSGATYHAGANLSVNCPAFSPDSALCYGSTGGVVRTVTTGIVSLLNFITSSVSRGSTWDAGAYQYGTGSSSGPNPPTGLTATTN